MCLTRPDAKPTRKSGVGYKSVSKRADGVYECYDHTPNAGSVRYPLNEWVTDPKEDEIGYRDNAYPAGFHIMLKRSEAIRILASSRHWHSPKDVVLIKVRFRQVVATQTKTTDYTYGPQVVAREVMNLGEVVG